MIVMKICEDALGPLNDADVLNCRNLSSVVSFEDSQVKGSENLILKYGTVFTIINFLCNLLLGAIR
jgi:hypothetical protein